MIRRGLYTPHTMHYEKLKRLVDAHEIQENH
jgi:hypothetical protein